MLWVLFELHWQVDAIQMSTHNICLYKEVDKKYTGCNLKTTELLDCALIGVCWVIWLNTIRNIHEPVCLLSKNIFIPGILSAVGLLIDLDDNISIVLQDNDSKKARAVKKANDERELKKQKEKEIDRWVIVCLRSTFSICINSKLNAMYAW